MKDEADERLVGQEMNVKILGMQWGSEQLDPPQQA